MLRIDHISKSFQGNPAVRDVSFSIAPYERVGLLGPNGAGKTTTLMMALGVTTPDSGSVHINGVAMSDNRALALESVGFAAAYMAPPRSLTVVETLRVAAGLADLPLKTDRIDEMIERFSIQRFVNRLGGELSSGQKTLVGLARAAMAKPKLLVLDEPTAYLDPSMSLDIRYRVEQACIDWGASLLITSHNMRDIDHLCSRIVFLRNGSVIHDTTPDALRTIVGSDDLDEAFIDLAAHDAAS
jgi:ABC-2 type transport system ATP-binding protein